MSQEIEEPKRASWGAHTLFGLVCALVVGTFIWSAEPGFLEFYSGDGYYNLLVQGFRAGHLYVNREPAPGLAQLPDPYDPAVLAPYVFDDQRLALDLSYYHGKLYLYFGVTPALVLFWPYAVLTGHYLSQTAAIVIFCSLGFLVGAGIVHRAWRRYFPETSVWVAILCVLALGWATGILEILSTCDVYEVAGSCGFAFAMFALAAVWCALHQPERRMPWLLLASLAYGLAIAARPPLLFGAVILLVPVMQAWRNAKEKPWRQVILLLGTASLPLVVIGVGLMIYNNQRFGSPFEFGWHYQMSDTNQHACPQQFSLRFLWCNLCFYFLVPMYWTAHFPYLKPIILTIFPAGYDSTSTSGSGILLNNPIVWLALAAPLAWRGICEPVQPLRWFVTAVFLLLVACATTLCLFQAARSRYELDFLPALMLLAVIGVFGLESALQDRRLWRYAVRFGWCLLLAYTVAFNVLVSIDDHANRDYFVGNYFFNHGKIDRAIEFYGKAATLEPLSPAWHLALGGALSRSGRRDESILQFQKALEISPDNAEAENNLGFTLLQAGRPGEAIPYFQGALQTQKTYQAYYNLAFALHRAGRIAEAIAGYRNSLQLQSQFLPAQTDLAWILATWPDPAVRNGNEAVTLAEQARQQSNSQNAQVLRVLAAGYAETGRFPDAMTTAKQALLLANTQSRSALAAEIQAELTLYETNAHCRSTNN